jgi:hypothetical protein
MAYSYIKYEVGVNASVGQTTFILAFEGPGIGYINREDIYLYINGVETGGAGGADSDGFTFNTSLNVTLKTYSPVSGDIIEFRRIMPKDDTYVAWVNGRISADDLNASDEAQLYLIHEIIDGTWTDTDIADTVSALQADVNNLVTLTGVPKNSEDLGTFTGSTISNGRTIKAAMQELESAVEERLVITDIDDTPVDGETSAPISSNWAYDHVAAADPHGIYLLENSIDYSPTNYTLDGGEDGVVDPHLSGIDDELGAVPQKNSANTLTSANDLNTLSDGWYRWGGSVPTNAPNGYMVLLQQTDSEQKTQIAFGSTSYGRIYVRRADSGVFYTWTEFLSNVGDLVNADYGTTEVGTNDIGVLLDPNGGLQFNGTSGIRFKETVAGDGLTNGANNGILAVNVDDTTIEISADKIQVKDGGHAHISGTDNRLVRVDGTNGLQDSGITVDDSDNVTLPADAILYFEGGTSVYMGVDGFGNIYFTDGVTGKKTLAELWAHTNDPITGATDNRLIRANGTNELQDSGITVDDSDNVTGVASLHLASGTSINEFSTDGTLSGNSDDVVPTEKAVNTALGNFLTFVPNVYCPDYNISDHGAAGTDSLYSIVATIGTTDKATVVFRHNSTSATTSYAFDTSLDLSSYTNISFVFENGARLTHVTGDETVTFYSADQLDFGIRQNVGDIDVFVFDYDLPKYGSVDVFPWVSSSLSNVRTPWGLWVDVSSSTTNGLQEAIDYAYGDGTKGNATYNLNVFGAEEDGSGGSYSVGGQVVFNCTEQLLFPPMQGTNPKFGAVTLNFTSAIGSDPAVEIDSCMMVDLDMSGAQVVSAGSGPVIMFRPTNPVPLDNITVIIDSKFHFTTAVNIGSTISGEVDSIVRFVAGTNGINGNCITFEEINDSSQLSNSVGIGMDTPSFGGYCANNYIRCMHVHNVAVGVQVGTSSNASSGISGNIYDLRIEGTDVAGSRAIDTWANGDIFRFGATRFDYGVKTQASAVNNLFEAGTLSVNTSQVNNVATDKTSNRVRFSGAISPSTISPTGSPYVYQNNSMRQEYVAISSGTVSSVQLSHDGTTYYTVFTATDNMVLVPPGMYLRVTYTSTPTMKSFIY